MCIADNRSLVRIAGHTLMAMLSPIDDGRIAVRAAAFSLRTLHDDLGASSPVTRGSHE